MIPRIVQVTLAIGALVLGITYLYLFWYNEIAYRNSYETIFRIFAFETLVITAILLFEMFVLWVGQPKDGGSVTD